MNFFNSPIVPIRFLRKIYNLSSIFTIFEINAAIYIVKETYNLRLCRYKNFLYLIVDLEGFDKIFSSLQPHPFDSTLCMCGKEKVYAK